MAAVHFRRHVDVHDVARLEPHVRAGNAMAHDLVPARADRRGKAPVPDRDIVYVVGTVPPSITISAPWMDAARAETRNAISSATS